VSKQRTMYHPYLGKDANYKSVFWNLKSAICLVSGGMDSLTLLSYLKSRKLFVHGLIFNYNQRHKKEIELAKFQCKELSVFYSIVNLDFYKGSLFKSSLVNSDVDVPNQCDRKQAQTVVPGRNSIFLSIGAMYAEAMGIESVFFGAVKDDVISYPDCRFSFVKSMSKALVCGNYIKGVYAPFVSLSKMQVIKLGITLGCNYSKTWSCYVGGKEPCFVCDACTERLNAFKSLGLNYWGRKNENIG